METVGGGGEDRTGGASPGMIDLVRRLLPRAAVARLRRIRGYVATIRNDLLSVDPQVFREALREVGVRTGSVLFIHSSLRQMKTIRATPSDLLKILLDSVGDAGTILMPSFPMQGLSQVYLERNPAFHWRRTPSESGFLTELFRRMPETERSLHPTHSVVAQGALAKTLTMGHERSETPFDEHSPFQKLLDVDASVLRLGRFDAMTFRHLADHHLQDSIPYPIYAARAIECTLTAKDGSQIRMVTRGHNPALTCDDHRRVLERMTTEGLTSTVRAGQVPLTLVSVRAYVEAYKRFFHDGLVRHHLRPKEC